MDIFYQLLWLTRNSLQEHDVIRMCVKHFELRGKRLNVLSSLRVRESLGREALGLVLQ